MKKHSFSATLLVALFVLSLVLSPFSGVFAANGTNITTPWNNDNNQFPSQTTTAGQLKVVDLEPSFSAFTDSLNRTLTYRVTGNDISSHTHVARNSSNNNHLTLYYTVQNAGNYVVTVIAEYIENDVVIDSASFDISIHVDSAAPASSAQTNYDETDANGNITVYVTVSNDGMPIRGNDGTQSNNGTVLACYPVSIHYFDLSDYTLSGYDRHPDEGGNVIRRPTLLHLYIYLIERFYMNVDPDDLMTGMSDILDYDDDTDVYYMDGSLAYSSGTNQAFLPSGGPQSLYMVNFWGHDANLMYYRNHVYPLMSAGWGATADYILLSDGDYIDIAMFSNLDFYSAGAFLCFNSDAFVTNINSNPYSFYTMMFPTSAVMGLGGSITAFTDELDVDIYNSSWQKVDDLTYNNNNAYLYAFSTAGTYYIVAKDIYAKSSSSCKAPAVAKVTVNP